jgi:hypothetical protein
MKNEQMADEQATRQMLEHEADGLERWKNLAKVTRFEYFLIFPSTHRDAFVDRPQVSS